MTHEELITRTLELTGENVSQRIIITDLVKALKDVTQQYSYDSLGPGCKLTVEKAIAKAEGTNI